ncbi:MAG: ABC transporter permease subunit, partial [Deltaproteobacteria bacterium]|nr:ABC transporter permease subunit [Deltaproteobacteria bacterium]
LGFIFAVIPVLVALVCEVLDVDPSWETTFVTILVHTNPYIAMAAVTSEMSNPGSLGQVSFFWLLYCGIALLASTLVLFISVLKVRKAALIQATGQLTIKPSRKRREKDATATVSTKKTAKIRTVIGSPTIWKELHTPLVGRRKKLTFVIISIALGILFLTYWLIYLEDSLTAEEVHISYTAIFTILGILVTAVIPATCITSEKEARSWPLLLATTLTDWQILFGKFVGSVRRVLPAWLLLFGHLVLFSIASNTIDILAIPMIVLVTASIIIFLVCSGLYFSARFRHSTTAVVANFSLAGTIWLLIPLLSSLVSGIWGGVNEGLAYIAIANPICQVVTIIDTLVDHYDLGCYTFYWPYLGSASTIETVYLLLVSMLFYVAIGLLFVLRAKGLLRRKIF